MVFTLANSKQLMSAFERLLSEKASLLFAVSLTTRSTVNQARSSLLETRLVFAILVVLAKGITKASFWYDYPFNDLCLLNARGSDGEMYCNERRSQDRPPGRPRQVHCERRKSGVQEVNCVKTALGNRLALINQR